MKNKKKPPKKSLKILSAREPKPYRVENAAGKARCLVVCDHASNKVPKSLKNLGLSKSQLQKHIAWDPGTEAIGRRIAKKIGSTAIFSTYSRLVVDLNRGADSAECMRDVSDHVRIPGNAKLTQAQKKQRLKELFFPYHHKLASLLKERRTKTHVPLVISVHSFTPRMDGFRRPWHIGVLWNREAGIAKKLVRQLRKNNPRLVIGENEPYSLKTTNLSKNTISTHAESGGLPYIILEFRQDLVNTEAKARKWADIFLQSLQVVLDDPDTHRPRKRYK